MRTMCFVILLLVLLILTGVSAETVKAPSLGVPVTLAVKGASLGEIADKLSADTKVKLRVSRDVADLKATVFLDKTPLREVMDDLATLFDLRWDARDSEHGRSYELYESLKSRQEREARLSREADRAWRQMDARLSAYVSDFPKSMDEFLASRQSAFDSVGTGGGEALGRLERQKSAAGAVLLRSLPKQARDALLAGMTVRCDSLSREPEWLIPADVAQVLSGASGRTGLDDQSSAARILHVNVTIQPSVSRGAEVLMIGARGLITVEEFRQSGAVQGVPVNSRDAIAGSFSILPQPLGVSASLTPPNHLPMEGGREPLSRKVSIAPTDLADEAAISGQTADISPFYVTRSDILAALHRKLGIQVVADHYSEWFRWSSQKEVTVESLVSKVLRAPQSYWGWDGRALYMRTVDSPLWDDCETPNRVLKQLREDSAGQGELALDDLARMAVLGDRRFDRILRDSRLLEIKTSLDESYLGYTRSILALRLYGTLTSFQHKTASNSGVRVADLTPEQRAILATCLAGPMSSTNPDDLRIRVGIYKNGIRIDKPEPPQSGDPVLVRMRPATRGDSSKTDQTDSVPGRCAMIFTFENGKSQEIPIPLP